MWYNLLQKGDDTMARWTADDLKYLKEDYPHEPTRDLAAKLGRSISAVRQKARKIGVTKIGRPGYRPPADRRIYTVNDEAMQTLTEKTAYVLGFVLADGSVSENRVRISNSNPIILAKIRNALGASHKITLERRGPHSLFIVTITNKTLAESFQQRGLNPTKSYDATLPDVPDNLFGHFLRGYFDGDGSARYSFRGGLQVRFVAGSRILLEQLSERLHILLGIRKQPVRHDKGRPTANRLWYSGTEALAIGKLMYANAGDLYIESKRQPFLDYENRPKRKQLTPEEVRAIRKLCDQGVVKRKIAREFGISPSLVSFIHNRTRWAHVD